MRHALELPPDIEQAVWIVFLVMVLGVAVLSAYDVSQEGTGDASGQTICAAETAEPPPGECAGPACVHPVTEWLAPVLRFVDQVIYLIRALGRYLSDLPGELGWLTWPAGR